MSGRRCALTKITSHRDGRGDTLGTGSHDATRPWQDLGGPGALPTRLRTQSRYSDVGSGQGRRAADTSEDAVVGAITGHLVTGLIVGAIASLLVPGRTPGGLLGVILLGIAGALLAGLIFDSVIL